jgi:hypothetical protein
VRNPIAGGVVLRTNLWHFPAWEIRVDAVQKRRILQFVGEYLEQMSIVRLWLTLLYIGVNVPAEHYRTLG